MLEIFPKKKNLVKCLITRILQLYITTILIVKANKHKLFLTAPRALHSFASRNLPNHTSWGIWHIPGLSYQLQYKFLHFYAHIHRHKVCSQI